MARRFAGRGRRDGEERRSRRPGCLFWLLVAIAVFLLLALLFGGYQKGSGVGGVGLSPPHAGPVHVVSSQGSPALRSALTTYR